MNYPICLKRPFIWLSRFRHRCGYGVHSPFAFSLITDVFYEKLPYYSYATLHAEKKSYFKTKGWEGETEKICRLLFRLVNRTQPNTIVEIGPHCISSLYLQAGKPSAHYQLYPPDVSSISLDESNSIDFLYINNYQNPDQVENTFSMCIEHATTQSLFVIRGICHSKAMKELWERMKANEKVGITFDLYDVGLLYFDRKKIKQHYIVNF